MEIPIDTKAGNDCLWKRVNWKLVPQISWSRASAEPQSSKMPYIYIIIIILIIIIIIIIINK